MADPLLLARRSGDGIPIRSSITASAGTAAEKRVAAACGSAGETGEGPIVVFIIVEGKCFCLTCHCFSGCFLICDGLSTPLADPDSGGA